VGLGRDPLSFLRKIEELLGRNISGSGLKNRDYGRISAALTKLHPLSFKVGMSKKKGVIWMKVNVCA
jgi:hypothetical protein